MIDLAILRSGRLDGRSEPRGRTRQSARVNQFNENEDLPNTTNTDDQARICRKKGE